MLDEYMQMCPNTIEVGGHKYVVSFTLVALQEGVFCDKDIEWPLLLWRVDEVDVESSSQKT